jgi:predicted Fe-Mo cluster-binding NifX family protein
MKYALPLAQGKLCMHFGHCEQFAMIDVDDSGKITGEDFITPPPHEPGVLPQWLSEKGANVIIAGGMGSRAQELFTQASIEVITGAPSEEPKKLVMDHISKNLETGPNACDH